MDYIEDITQHCEKAVWYFHPGGKKNPDRPHLHALLFNCTLTDDALRDGSKSKKEGRRIGYKEQFGLKNRTEHGISNKFDNGKIMNEFSYPKYISYMSKGIYDPVLNKGFTQMEIDLYKGSWVEPKNETEDIIRREVTKPKMTQWRMGQEAEIRYLEKYGDAEVDYMNMSEIIVELCYENKTLAHDNRVVQIIQDIQARAEPAKFFNRIRKRIEF